MAENEVGPMRPRADSNQVSMKRNLAANGGHTNQSGTSLSRRSSGRRLSLVQRKLSCDLQEDVRVAMSNSEHRGLLYDGLRNGTPDSEYERIERWLDEHPDFVADYFVRKADYRLVSAWVDRRGAPSRFSDENWDRTTSASTTAKTSDATEPGASPGGARVAFALDLLQPPSADASKYTVKAHEALWLSSRADDSLARLVAKADGIRLRPSMRHSVSGMSMPSSRKVSLNSVAERPSWHSELDERIQASLHNGSGFDRCDEPLRNGLPNGLELHSRRKSASTRSVALSCAECSCQSTENSRFWCELLVDLSASNDDVTRMGQRVALAVCQLLGCESASIFTVAASVDAHNAEDSETKRPDREPAHSHLVCRALNVRARTTLEEQAALAGAESDHHSLTLPFGPAGGLVGIVAQTGEPVRLEDASSDERFNHELDSSEWRTQSVLMVPIKTRDGQLVGVAVACNRLASALTCGTTFQFCVSEAGKAQLPLCDNAADCVSDSASRRLSTSPSEGYADRQTSTLSELVAAAERHSPVPAGSRKASSQSECVLRQLSEQADCDAFGTNGRKTSQPELGSRRSPAAPDFSRPASLPERAYAPFVLDDENNLIRLVGVCAFALRNATHFEKSQLDKRRSEVLLELARCIFREQVELHTLIYKIMMYAQSISRCERCQLLLIDDTAVSAKDKDTKMGMFSQVYDLSTDAEPNTCDNTPRFPINLAVSEYVATTGDTVNVADVDRDPRFSRHRADSAGNDSPVLNGCPVRSVLCMPIRNGQDEVIGVCVLANKRTETDTVDHGEHEAAFERDDERFFEAFTLFCGLGIHQTKMYERAIRAVAKQRVALEVLSYHATASVEEAQRLRKMNIPSARFYQLFDFAFSDFSLTDDDTLKCALRMFIDLKLVETFRIDYAVLCRWLLSVKKNYRNVTYHNWRHALNVAQSMFAMLVKANDRLLDTLNDAERLGLLVACLCHDLDHRGTNNQFQIKSASALAQLYSTSVMEHHHFDQACMLLQAKGNEIFSNLSQEQYDLVLSIIEKAILATDLALYFKFREGFFRLVGRRPPHAPPDAAPCAVASPSDWQLEANRSLLRSMMMTACDLSAIYKPWDVQKRVAELVFGEFFEQGDIERSELNLVPDDMMNRHKKDLLPAMQVGYIDAICMPLYDAFALFHEAYVPLRDTCARNRQNWQALAQVRSQRDREQHTADATPPAAAAAAAATESSASPPPAPPPSAAAAADKAPKADTPARV